MKHDRLFSLDEANTLVPQIELVMERMQRIGIKIQEEKDLELGLVDFPAQVGDEEIYLCWQYGEKEIGYFHRQTQGFSGRRPIGDQSAKPRYQH